MWISRKQQRYQLVRTSKTRTDYESKKKNKNKQTNEVNKQRQKNVETSVNLSKLFIELK